MAYVGVALMVGLSGMASCIGTSIAGMASVGAMKKNAGAFGSYMILAAVRAGYEKGIIKVTLTSEGCETRTVEITTV